MQVMYGLGMVEVVVNWYVICIVFSIAGIGFEMLI